LTSIGLKVEELQCHGTQAWTAILNNHLTLLLGRGNMEQRIQRFTKKLSFIKKLSSYPNLTIDLRYANGFAVKSEIRTPENLTLPQKLSFLKKLSFSQVTLPQKLSFFKQLSFSGNNEVTYAS
jgi:hypothetical protein